MNLKAGKLPLTWGHAETVAFMCEKTGLKRRTVV